MRLLGFILVLLAQQVAAQQVFTSGAARNVMMGTDLSATVQLDSLNQMPNLFALGPVEDLQGEITVLNGVIYSSYVANGKIVCFENPRLRAPFLAYSYIALWKQYEVAVDLKDLKSVEQMIDSLGRAHGYSEDDAFPFLMEAQWNMLEFHIIMRDTTEEKHSHESHDRAKVKFRRNDAEVTMLGFFSRHHQGVFTHRGHFTHIHYVRHQPCETGHLDDVTHRGLVTIKLPIMQ